MPLYAETFILNKNNISLTGLNEIAHRDNSLFLVRNCIHSSINYLMYNLLYDGTFAGFLTALNRKMHQPALELSIKQANGFGEDLYSQDFVLETQVKLAKQMYELLKNNFSRAEIQFMKQIIKQGKPGCEDLLCNYILHALCAGAKNRSTADDNDDSDLTQNAA